LPLLTLIIRQRALATPHRDRTKNHMTYSRQKAIEDIRQACSVDDAAIHGRSVVLKDVLKSLPIVDGSVDRTEGGIVFISAAAKSHDAERIKFQWQINQSLADQSDETLRVISELLKA
jgi:hypothetical protein